MMDIYRPSTRDSQRAFLQSQQQQPRYSHDRRVSQATSGATTAVQSQLSLSSPLYSDEKSVVEPPLPDPLRVQGSVNIPGTYPLATINAAHHNGGHQGQGYSWSPDGDFDPVPRYPGTPAAAPATLAVPPIGRERRRRLAGTICGVKRGLLLLLLVVGGLVLLAIAIGVGVGVGLAKKPSDSGIAAGLSTTPSSTINSSIPATTIFITTTIVTNPTSTSSVIPSATPTGLSCPSSQGSQYTATNNKKFITLCGVDYSGKGEANEISNAKVKTFRDCLELCSKKRECTGAGWGVMEGDKAGEHTCWMKNGLNASHVAVLGWGFGVLLAE